MPVAKSKLVSNFRAFQMKSTLINISFSYLMFYYSLYDEYVGYMYKKGYL